MRDANYGKFTATERLALMVEALARQDYVEADRLIDTCERKRYVMPDAAYAHRFMGLYLLALFSRVMILEEYAKGSTALAVATALAKKTDADSKAKLDQWAECLQKADRRTVGIWNAWEEFCDKAGVDAEKTMGMGWEPIPGYFKNGVLAFVFPGETCAPEPDDRAYETAKTLFHHHWDMIEQRVLAAT